MQSPFIGRKVMIIADSVSEHTADHGRFPPIGTVGTIVEDIDIHGDYEVYFPAYLMDPPAETWTIHRSHIVFTQNFDTAAMAIAVSLRMSHFPNY